METRPLRHPVVAIPARDEEQRLAPLLRALAAQSWIRHHQRPLSVVLVLNNCTDGSRAVVARTAQQCPRLDLDVLDVTFDPDRAHVGSARRMALERALERAGEPRRAALLTTDADAVPAPDWVDGNLVALAEGADIVGGLLIGDPDEEARLGAGFRRRADAILSYARLADRLASLIDPLAHDPWPRHGDHTGGSLAVRAEVYRAVGGLPALSSREDLALVRRVRLAGGRLRHDLRVRVQVSARLEGRAEGGMAQCLREWLRDEREGRPPLVEDPRELHRRLQRRRHLRTVDLSLHTVRRALAEDLGIDPALLVDGAGRPLRPEVLIDRHAPDGAEPRRVVPLAEAMPVLRLLISSLDEAPVAA